MSTPGTAREPAPTQRRTRITSVLVIGLILTAATLAHADTRATTAASSEAAAVPVAASPSATATEPPAVVLASTKPASNDNHEDELIAFDTDEDEFEGVTPPAAEAPATTSSSFPAAEALHRGFLGSYLSLLLSLFGMSSRSSSASPFLSSHWLSVSLGAVFLAGALLLGYTRPWANRGAKTRRKKKEEHPALQPLLVEVKSKRGRVQGHDWVEKNLKKDQDGDEAHEFLGPF